ncbi:MAG: ribosome silencing factor [Pseudomonadota bacterium]
MADKKYTENMENDQGERLLEIVVAALADIKGVDIRVIDVRGLTSITDRMVIASGTSSRHIKALADNVVLETKQNGFPALGVEGENGSEWVLVDLADVVVHIMMPEIREFYALEKLWSVGDHNNASA